MTKEEFIKRVSKINSTGEDEFRAMYNSPEKLYDMVISKIINKNSDIHGVSAMGLKSLGFEKINNSMWRLEGVTLQNATTTEGETLIDRIVNQKKAYKVCIDGKYLQMVTEQQQLEDILRGYKISTRVSNCNIPLVSSCISVGDEVLYVGSYVGKVINESDVRLKDGTVVCSLRSQPQKFRKII